MCVIFGTAYLLDPWTLNKWKGYRENLVPTGRAELSWLGYRKPPYNLE
jgi:hypothetical protein